MLMSDKCGKVSCHRKIDSQNCESHITEENIGVIYNNKTHMISQSHNLVFFYLFFICIVYFYY
jgi:hypothetical protein